MKKYLILVKHSLPKIVENVPAQKWELSEAGRVRAQKLAVRLNGYHPEAITSSIEPKAKQTAEIIAAKHNLELHFVEGLHEHDRSKVGYLRRDELQAAMREFFEKPGRLVFGSETADVCHARFEQAVHSIIDQHLDKTIVIVAHGTVISLFVARLTGISDQLLWNDLALPSFVVVDVQTAELIERENIL
jgi:broad specificity phosphatase PhoE